MSSTENISNSFLENKNPKHISILAHEDDSIVTGLLFHRGLIITSSDRGSIKIHAPTGSLIRSLDGHTDGVWAIAARKGRIVSGSQDRTVRVWDMNTGKCTHVFAGHSATVRCLSIVNPEWIQVESGEGEPRREKWPKRSLIVTGSRDCSLRVWTLPRSGDEEYAYSGEDSAKSVDNNPYHKFHLTGHTGPIRSIATRGRVALSASYDHHVFVWDIVTGECKWRLAGHTAKVYDVVLDLDRNRAFSGSMDKTIRVWNLRAGQCEHVLTDHESLVALLGISPSYLVSASPDTTLRVWDSDKSSLLHTLEGHTDAVTCLSQDDFRVVSGSFGMLKLWDMRNGSLVRDLLTEKDVKAVWKVVLERQWCIAATNRKFAGAVVDVWDFGMGDGDIVGEIADDRELSGEDNEDE